jgi:hypothetical protein
MVDSLSSESGSADGEHLRYKVQSEVNLLHDRACCLDAFVSTCHLEHYVCLFLVGQSILLTFSFFFA